MKYQISVCIKQNTSSHTTTDYCTSVSQTTICQSNNQTNRKLMVSVENHQNVDFHNTDKLFNNPSMKNWA